MDRIARRLVLFGAATIGLLALMLANPFSYLRSTPTNFLGRKDMRKLLVTTLLLLGLLGGLLFAVTAASADAFIIDYPQDGHIDHPGIDHPGIDHPGIDHPMDGHK